MSEVEDEALVVPRPQQDGPHLEWSSYAPKYDTICEYNPAYQENLERLKSYVMSWGLDQEAKIADLGAGTGNFICAMADVLPQATYTHIDFDPCMNKVARAKYEQRETTRVRIVEDYLQRVEIPDQSFDLIVCVNVLYAVAPQTLFLKRVKRWLKPGGRFFVIDFGRKVKIFDWGWYFLKNTMREHSFSHFIRVLMDNYEFVRQNKNAQHDFEEGYFWEHSTDEFKELLVSTGFSVEELYTCYRDYCDLAICR
jgi:ubiquinone/menaquinone biosynthesis C-methylase UbiE